MAITLVNAQSAVADTGASPLAVTKPTGTASGDVLIAIVCSDDGDEECSIPSGFTNIFDGLISNGSTTNDAYLNIGYLIAGGSEPTSYDFTHVNGGEPMVAGLAAFRGVDNTTPLDATPTTNTEGTTADTTHDCASITTVTANAAILCCFGNEVECSVSTPHSGFTSVLDISTAVGGAATTGAAAQIYWDIQETSGASGTLTFTVDATDSYTGVTVALRPVATAQTISAGQATETDTANAVGIKRTLTTGQATETGTASAVSGAKAATTGLASATETATAVGGAKVATTGLASVTDTASAVSSGKVELALQASEETIARAVTANRALAVAAATEADAATTITLTGSLTVGIPAETDTAAAMTWLRTAGVGVATATDAAQAVAHARALAVGLSGDTSSSFGMGLSRKAVVSLANEGDTATSIVVAGGEQPETGGGGFCTIRRRRRWI